MFNAVEPEKKTAIVDAFILINVLCKLFIHSARMNKCIIFIQVIINIQD